VSDEELAGEKSYSAPALEKGLDILEGLAERSSGMSVRDLAEQQGRSKNEIFRMIHVLIARGYVQRDADTDELVLTNKLFTLGLRTPQSRSLLEAALPEMTKLALDVGQSVHLVVVHKGMTVTLGHARAEADFAFNLKPGYGRLASEAASGRVIMAFQAADRRERMLADCAMQSKKTFDRPTTERALADIRARGFVLGRSTDFVGVTDICCPILRADGQAAACLIVAHVDRVGQAIDTDRLLAAVQSACERIGKLI
jgi:DNA-binding IclR family transcriptional regulator